MPTSRPAEVARELIESVWNGRDEDRVDQLVGPDVPGLDGTGPRAVLAWHRDRRSSFSDLRYSVESCVQEADVVAVRWTARGTHDGMFGPLAPTGRSVSYAGATFLTVRDGRVIAVWSVNELFQLLSQLGAELHPPAQ